MRLGVDGCGLRLALSALLNAVLSCAACAATLDLKTDKCIYDGRTAASVVVQIGQVPSLDGLKLDALLKDPSGQEVWKKTFDVDTLSVCFNVPTGIWQDGNGVLKVVLSDRRGAALCQAEDSFRLVPPPKPRRHALELRGNVPYLDGKPFFARITWHCGAIPKDGEGRESILARTDAEFAEMAEAGINVVITQERDFSEEPDKHFKSTRNLWDEHYRRLNVYRANRITFDDIARSAKKHGIALIVEPPFTREKLTRDSLDIFARLVGKLRERDDVLLWHTADETDQKLEANELRRRIYAEIDPERLTWFNMMTPYAVDQNRNAADILSTDYYPVPNAQDFSYSIEHMDKLVSVTRGRPRMTAWTWVQNYGYKPTWNRAPTPREIRALTYLSLNHGATGIGFFNWTQPERRDGVAQHPDGVKAMRELSAEIEAEKEMWLLGDRLYSERRNGIDLVVIEHGGRRYFSAVNVTDQPSGKVVFDIPCIGRKAIGLGPYEQKMRIDQIEGDAISISLSTPYPLPGTNYLGGLNADFADGLSGWTVKGGRVFPLQDGMSNGFLRVATTEDVWASVPPGAYPRGRPLVLSCRVRTKNGYHKLGECGVLFGPGCRFAAFAPEYRRGVTINAHLDLNTDGCWRRVTSVPQVLPGWAVGPQELYVSSIGTTEEADVDDIGLHDAFVAMTITAHAAKGLRQVRLVDGNGSTMYDSGDIGTGSTAFRHVLDVISAQDYTLTVLDRAGRVKTLRLCCGEQQAKQEGRN